MTERSCRRCRQPLLPAERACYVDRCEVCWVKSAARYFKGPLPIREAAFRISVGRQQNKIKR